MEADITTEKSTFVYKRHEALSLFEGIDKLNVIYDMETNDPDDFFALCFLLSHPRSVLRGVTLYPGSKTQVGLVRKVLEATENTHVLVGSSKPDHPKIAVSKFHFRVFPDIKEEQPDGSAEEVMHKICTKYPDTIIISGGPPFNLASFLQKHSDITLRGWIGQGGFAGDNVVEKEHRLSKFDGKTICVAANWMSTSTLDYLLSCERIKVRVAVSKNVCHGIVYDKAFHEQVEKVKDKTKGLGLIYRGMQIYLDKNADGKKFHDPLAAAVAFDPTICRFEEVKLYHNDKRKWGSIPQQNTNTFISVACNLQQFISVLCEY